MTRSKRKDPLVWGIVLIVVGALFLLQNTIDVWWTIARLWPVLLIAWGALKLYNGLKEREQETQAPGKTQD
ncbi:LiaI-LiaF-like domain-containing protein [Acidobacteriota bacterium]